MLQVGDRVTVQALPDDPVEIAVHRHAVITAVASDGYVVGHPPAQRQFGPFPEDRLKPGWRNER